MFDFQVKTVDKHLFGIYNKNISFERLFERTGEKNNDSGRKENMNTRRLHHQRKRKRQVYLKKMFFCAATFVFVLCLSVLAGSRMADAHVDSQNTLKKYYKSIEVESGDTLWDIASEYAGTDNQEKIRSYVGEIMKINGMTADTIQSGEYLTVVYYAD